MIKHMKYLGAGVIIMGLAIVACGLLVGLIGAATMALEWTADFAVDHCFIVSFIIAVPLAYVIGRCSDYWGWRW